MTVIGDGPKKQEKVTVVALPQSQVTLAELLDIDDPVNDKEWSGKKIGGVYFYEVEADVVSLVMATGDAVGDPWIDFGGLAALTALTNTVAGDVGDAAGITVQMNLIETAYNALITGAVIQPV